MVEKMTCCGISNIRPINALAYILNVEIIVFTSNVILDVVFFLMATNCLQNMSEVQLAKFIGSEFFCFPNMIYSVILRCYFQSWWKKRTLIPKLNRSVNFKNCCFLTILTLQIIVLCFVIFAF